MLKIAYSPCPNDTFIFHAWSHGLVPGAPPLQVEHADIDRTNYWATDADCAFDILKISYAALPYVLDRFALLPCGGALGRGCGPLLLTRKSSSDSIKHGLYKKIAVPSDRSTAYLLMRLWLAEQPSLQSAEIQIIPFEQIMPALCEGVVDAGLVIHEARFTYPAFGLEQLVDLGEWWEETTGQLIPLGAIVAKRTLNHPSIANSIRASLEHAHRHPEDSRDYIRCHAQELLPEVTEAHIRLYVNSYTSDIGDEGRCAVRYLFERSVSAGLLAPFDWQLLEPLTS